MKVVKHLEEKVEEEHEALLNLKEEVEEVVEETLVGRRRSRRTSENEAGTTTSDESSSSTRRTSSSASSTVTDVSVDLDTSKTMAGSISCGGVRNENPEKVNNSVYADNNEGTTQEWSHAEKTQKVEDSSAKVTDAHVQKVLSAVINGGGLEKNLKDQFLSGSTLPPSVTKPQEENLSSMGAGTDQRLQIDIVDEIDEEVIELEFERAVEKMHSHQYNMYCPSCSRRITKVVLRRRKIEKNIPVASDGSNDKPLDLLGCLPCFRIFIPAENRLNPLRIFGDGGKSDSSQIAQQQQPSDGGLSAHGSAIQKQSQPDVSLSASGSTHDKGKCFNLFWIFRRQRVDVTDSSSQRPPFPSAPGIGSSDIPNQASSEFNNNGTLVRGKPSLGLPVSNGDAGNLLHPSPPQGSILNGDAIIDVDENLGNACVCYGAVDVQISCLYHRILDSLWIHTDDGVKHPMKSQGKIEGQSTIAGQYGENITDPLTQTEAPSTRSLEILKSIVYGGLMESITSLSVVSSAAASDATTLNIVALGLANLMGGLLVLGHNLKDLRYDESDQTNEQANKYQQLLGQREHFFLHATLAVLSYLVFGLMPPVIYGFAFRGTDDKDYKLLAVAAASLICIVILAIAKAYIRGQHKFMAYFKTVMYYVSTAVMVSGIAYAVGDLVKKLMERLGWFDSSSAVEALFIPDTKSFNPSWASY